MLSRLAVLPVFVLVLAVGCLAQSEGKLPPVPSKGAASHATPGRSLPETFVSILPEVKAKSRIPVLLPSKLPMPIGNAKHALVEKAAANEYAVSLYYDLGIGDAGFAALFAAQATPTYNPRELKGIHEVKLARGIRGFFRPLSCGGSCAPVNLWWEEGGVLYQIQVELSPAISEQDQAITAVADSAILADPR
jgi:hypothetical protein